MSLDSIPQFSLGTAILIIFLVCVGFVMLRGIARMIVGTAVLAVSAWLGFIAWQEAPGISLNWFGKSVGFVTTGMPIVVFLGSFILIRILAKTITRPFGNSSDEESSSGNPLITLVGRLLLALIPTALICLIGAIFIHHTGTVAELTSFAEKKNSKTHEPPSSAFITTLKSSIEKILPASWIKTLDPLADQSRLALAKLITAQAETPQKPVIDPLTGKPIPRAIIVEDTSLQNLAREGKFGTLLRHPLLTKALNDPKVQSLIKNQHL